MTRSSPSARRSSASTPTSPVRSSTPARGWRSSPTTPSRRIAATSQLTVLAEPGAVCRGLVARLAPRSGPAPGPFARPAPPPAAGAGRAATRRACSSPRWPNACRPTRSWSRRRRTSRPELHARVARPCPAGLRQRGDGRTSASRLPGSIGLRMALPDRPVLAVVGDGSSMYAIQALWSAARYGVGALFIVLANGRYAIMDKLAATTPASPRQWPAFDTIDIAAIARALGCESIRIDDHADLLARLDDVLPALARARDASRARGRRRAVTTGQAAVGDAVLRHDALVVQPASARSRRARRPRPRCGARPAPACPGTLVGVPTSPRSKRSAQISFGKKKCAEWSPWRWPISRWPTLKANSPRRPGPAVTPRQEVTSSVICWLAVRGSVIDAIVRRHGAGSQGQLVLGPSVESLLRYRRADAQARHAGRVVEHRRRPAQGPRSQAQGTDRRRRAGAGTA